eukprot:jgi/Mesvir1/28471/Mv15892-RA.1
MRDEGGGRVYMLIASDESRSLVLIVCQISSLEQMQAHLILILILAGGVDEGAADEARMMTQREVDEARGALDEHVLEDAVDVARECDQANREDRLCHLRRHWYS